MQALGISQLLHHYQDFKKIISRYSKLYKKQKSQFTRSKIEEHISRLRKCLKFEMTSTRTRKKLLNLTQQLVNHLRPLKPNKLSGFFLSTCR